MIKIVRFFGKLLGALLIPIFILASFMSILLLSLGSQLFNPDFYLEVFQSEDFFDKLPEVAADQITYAMGYNPCLEDPDLCEGEEGSQVESTSGGPPSYFQALSKNDWEKLISGVLPPEWLEDKVVELTEGLFQAFETGDQAAEVVISLEDFKQRLGGPEGVDAIVGVLDAQPTCTEDDLLDMTRILEGSEDPGESFLSCRPSDDFIEKYTPHLEVMIRKSLRDVPDEIDLGKGLFSADRENAVGFFGYEVPPALVMRSIHWFIKMSPLFCVGLMLLIGLLAVHSFKGLGGWWGYPITISGLMGLGLALLVSPLAGWASTMVQDNRSLTGISPILVETGSSLAVQVIQTLLRQVRNYSLITFGIGLAIIITTAVISPAKKSVQDPEPESETSEELDEGKKEEVIPDADPEPEEDQSEESETVEVDEGDSD